METVRRKVVHLAGVLAATAGFAIAVPAQGFAENIVVDWNAIAISTALAAAQGPVPQTRSMAIVAVAVNDAVNAISRRYATYDVVTLPPTGASVDAAAAGAAYRALTLLYPSQAATLDVALAASLSKYSIAEFDPGFWFGESVAEQIVGLRLNDDAAYAQFEYTAPGAGSPGVWVPTPPASLAALLPGWGQVLPWVLRAGWQFRPDEGPSLTSDQYTRDFNEVKEMGSLTSATRTSEQTNIARFWLTSAVVIWNGALRVVAVERGLDTSEAAHAFALVNVTGADAAIACWDAKYAFNFWRPITAIRNADVDDNPSTSPDPAWVSLVPTPPFPEFTSGHTVISGAMATMLGLLFGDDPGVTFTVSSPTNPGFTRTWSSFSAGIDEVIDARVWTGIHFRTSDVEGARMGRQVARFVFEHALRRARP
jgi:membrane-associated phospholipid phosphatase